jgi:transposase
MAPLVRRTWAPRGQTPLLWQRTNSYRKVSVIASLVVSARRDAVRLYFRLYPDSNINALSVLEFLRQLSRHLRGPAILLWDRFMPHRAGVVKAYIGKKTTWHPDFFPAYAPELNPMENAWGYLKTNPLANETPFDLRALTEAARRHGRALQKRQRLLRSFIKHTPLFLRLK